MSTPPLNETAKFAQPQHPVLEVIRRRWSPRAFSPRPVEPEKLAQCFEAARWAASSMNEQPWRFVVGLQGQGSTWQRLFDSMGPYNQAWNTRTPVLILNLGKLSFSHNGKPNFHNLYDCGQASALLCLQATVLGLHTHQMAGFSTTKVRVLLHLPDEYHPNALIALGYRDEPHVLPSNEHNFAEDELAPRTRKPLSELVFGEAFGEPLPL